MENEATPTEAPAGTSFFRRHSTALIVGGATAFAVLVGGGGIAIGASLAYRAPVVAAAPQQVQVEPAINTEGTTTAATDEQTVGVVTIVSDLYYSGQASAAGTGIILTTGGEILTNNHVIAGSTTIEVTVESTGETYAATVVGTDATNDVAVLQLEDAPKVTPAALSDDAAKIGDAITDVGNAEGTGDLVAATGIVSDLEQSITVQSDLTGEPETLNGLIELNADVVSGDSGGPVLNEDGEVVGIATAASSGSRDITGFAIPIEDALEVVEQIRSGETTDTVVIGLPAFLGVEISATQGATGVTLENAIEGLPAALAGLVAGDTITAINDTATLTPEALSAAIASYQPGDVVRVTYLDASGNIQSLAVTLGEGPAA